MSLLGHMLVTCTEAVVHPLCGVAIAENNLAERKRATTGIQHSCATPTVSSCLDLPWIGKGRLQGHPPVNTHSKLPPTGLPRPEFWKASQKAYPRIVSVSRHGPLPVNTSLSRYNISNSPEECILESPPPPPTAPCLGTRPPQAKKSQR